MEGGSGKGTAAHASGLLLGLAEGSHRQLHARGYGGRERERGEEGVEEESEMKGEVHRDERGRDGRQ